jgi:hypothetical protein
MIDMGVDAGVALLTDPSVDPGHFAEQTYQALQHQDYRLFAALAVIGLVWAARKFGGKLPGKLGDFMRSDRGGAVLALVMGVLENVAHAALAGSLTAHAVMDGLVNGVLAAGGYSAAKKMLPVAPQTTTVLKVVALCLFMGLGAGACIPAQAAAYTTIGVKARELSVAADALPGVRHKLEHDCAVNAKSRADGLQCMAKVEGDVKQAGHYIEVSLKGLVFVQDMAVGTANLVDDPKNLATWVTAALQSYADAQAFLDKLGYKLGGQ